MHEWVWSSALSKLVEIVTAAGIIQGIFLALVLTTRKNRTSRPNKILAVLLVVLAVSILHTVLVSGKAIGPYKIREPLILLVGPLLLFYVRAFIKPEDETRSYLLHFLPFLLFFLFSFVGALLGPDSGYGGFLAANSAILSIIVWGLIVAQYGFYWLRTVRLIHLTRTAVESEYSNVEGRTLSWMNTFLHIFGILLLLFGGTVIFAIHSTRYSAVDTLVAFGLSCAIFVLGYQGLFQEEIFSNADPAPAAGDDTTYRTRKANVNAEEEAALATKILAFFEEKKPYLDEALTLTKLADQLGITRNQLSALINSRFESNFYNFVNRYRVDEVKRLMADPRNKDFTILSLAFDAGFPSKSTFHDIFKKQMGMTPSEYQNNVRQQKAVPVSNSQS